MLTPFGRAIREIRKSRKLTLREMAKALHVTSSYLSCIELGKRNIPNDLIKKINAICALSDKELEILEKSIIYTDQINKSINIEHLQREQKNLVKIIVHQLKSDVDSKFYKLLSDFIENNI